MLRNIDRFRNFHKYVYLMKIQLVPICLAKTNAAFQSYINEASCSFRGVLTKAIWQLSRE